ncbi:methyltransferase [Hirsutella rhossiliensis]|uniref:Methyltransferase domain-containing protein n=1 Tax=Hirsutella rhossiliensis TaxID=111463 RepID=A0A9P8SKV7_9HYPO|nr:methyltransferase domain-containing protein [Hirsutella rhossiliensis]KAH0965180.1 methyltransferase domain-containing protein [Hirsutella rhossiliensis]
MRLLDLLMRDNLDSLNFQQGQGPPESLLQYIRSIRDLSLRRDFSPTKRNLPVLPRSVAVGMKPKKIHEVRYFADYIERLSNDISGSCGRDISHLVDFGSGQNYLGRALASAPYNRRVVAVEGRENNVAAARHLDRLAGLTVNKKVRRNKKLWNQVLEVLGPDKEGDPRALAEAVKQVAGAEAFDFRPADELGSQNELEAGKGHVQYVSGRLESGDLAGILAEVKRPGTEDKQRPASQFMAISIHSCGNLSHHGIRSLVLNPDIRAIAIVGCCYNLVTEKLGPPTYKHAYLRPTLQALNGRVVEESDKRDPQGFPMSKRFSSYRGEGIRLNITARMMACQAPQNWTRDESEDFFTRHFYRAVLQKIFLDRGVVGRVRHGQPGHKGTSGAFDVSTNPVVIGSLRKHCYGSLRAYVRGAVEKLTTSADYKQYAEVMRDKMAGMTDEEIDGYEEAYQPRRRELCVIWSLMAFSATAVESLIVADRWTYLVEHGHLVKQAWVETVFDYRQSPRNLVVVGVKRDDA